MERILERDAPAFETLFARYEEMLRRYLMRTVRNDDIANDLVQEAFLRVWTKAEQWSGKGTFKSWFFRIATNLTLNHLRSVSRRKEQPLEIPADEENGDEPKVPGWMIDMTAIGSDKALELAERKRIFRRVIDQLPEEKRDVVRMVYEAEMDVGEIAETLGIPKGTVKSRLHYATRQLAREWRDEIE